MINATERQCHRYQIGELLIVELRSLPSGRSWTIFRDADVVAILAGLSEQERRRALAEALAELVASS